MTDKAPYSGLEPGIILDAVEQAGFQCNGSLLALNSYENRVYQVGIEDDKPLIAKFYRPNRWSEAAILEEHDYSLALQQAEVPVIAPLQNENGDTLLMHEGFRYALFPRQGGHWPELDMADNLTRIGRFLARIHMLGSAQVFQDRPTLTVQAFGNESYQYLLEHGFLPPELELTYRSVVEDVLLRVNNLWQAAGSVRNIRLHGDCHPGNILWTDDGPHFVDLDDTRMGPAIQDLWMLLSGDRHEMEQQLAKVLRGYVEFMDFNPAELNLIEALRTLRMIHYAAWLARRWGDPAFLQAFPWFNTQRYWEEHILQLREQMATMEEPVLNWI